MEHGLARHGGTVREGTLVSFHNLYFIEFQSHSV